MRKGALPPPTISIHFASDSGDLELAKQKGRELLWRCFSKASRGNASRTGELVAMVHGNNASANPMTQKSTKNLILDTAHQPPPHPPRADGTGNNKIITNHKTGNRRLDLWERKFTIFTKNFGSSCGNSFRLCSKIPHSGIPLPAVPLPFVAARAKLLNVATRQQLCASAEARDVQQEFKA
jgi:hypothetical protein